MTTLTAVKQALDSSFEPAKSNFIFALCQSLKNDGTSGPVMQALKRDLATIGDNANTSSIDSGTYADDYPDGGGSYQDNED